MRIWRMLTVPLRSLVRRRATDDELDEEIRYHLERDVERRMAGGESETEARRAARRDFGNVTALTEEARSASRMDAISS